jgi:tagatose 6-phosphate kinase
MGRADAVIVAANSAVDSYYILSRFEIGQPNRATRVYHTAGGKGINMARALAGLGGRALCLGIVGGHMGRFVVDELAREGIAHDMVAVDTETRRCSTIFAEGLPDVTVLLEPGHPAGQQAGDQLGERVMCHSEEAPYLVLAGSLPPDLPADYYATLIKRLRKKRTSVCLDCSGEALRLGAEAGPALVKVNRMECCQAFGLDVASSDWMSFQQLFDRLHAGGVETLIVTAGRYGTLVFSSDNPTFLVMTRVEAWVSTAGAGDTYLAGLVLSLGRGEGLESAASFGSAAASANLQQVGCGFLKTADVDKFLGQTTIVHL